MPTWDELKRRLTYLLRRSAFDSELEEEIRFHLATRIEDLMGTGLSKAEATAQARREFGPQARLREDSRSAWQFSVFEDLLSDLRYSLRAVRRNPSFTAAAVLSLALGIGANLAIFSITMEFLFSRPSVRDSHSLAYVTVGGNSNAEPRLYRFLQQAQIFDGVAGLNPESEANWRYGDETHRIFATRITPNFFDVTGASVALGRPVHASDQREAVLSYGFWKGRLGGDPAVLGRALTFDGALYTVVGILPADHRTVIGFGFSPDVYLTVDPSPTDQTSVMLYVRLPEGSTRKTTYPRLLAVCRELDRVYPQSNFKWAQNVWIRGIDGMERLQLAEGMPLAPFFAMLMTVVSLILLVACANVSSLLLARAAGRQHELAIRQSIGASRNRIVRQLLSETFLLTTLGTIAGLLITLVIAALANRIPLSLPVPIHPRVQPDWRLFSYAAGLAIVSALFCGLVPALKSTRRDVQPILKLSERVLASRHGFQRGLVVAQLTVSVVLVLVGFLFVRNLALSHTLNPGFDLHHTVWARVRLVPDRYSAKDPAETSRMLGDVSNRALERLRSLPGIETITTAAIIPFNDNIKMGSDIVLDDGTKSRLVYTGNWIGADYFKTMRIPLLSGREFSRSDRENSGRVVILNQSMAHRLFGNKNPLGHTVRFADDPPSTIVGIAQNSKYFSLGEDSLPAVYRANAQFPSTSAAVNFLLRTEAPEGILKEVNRALGEIDPTAAIEVKPLNRALGLALLPSRVGAALLGSMGALGLLLASIGLYGVLVYSVNSRVRELGIRMALGAQPSTIGFLVVRSSLTLVGIGLTLGGLLGYFATPLLAMFLVPELSAHDPISVFSVLATLLFVGFVATSSPTLRALRLDPTVALRYE